MKPVNIDIKKASDEEVKLECIRLGITGWPRSATSSLRKKLKTHARDYKIWQDYCRFATLLFGEIGEPHTATLHTVTNYIHGLLYKRLYEEGYVCLFVVDRDDKIQDVAAFTMLEDPANNQQFFITGRQNAQIVNTKIFRQQEQLVGDSGSCSIIYAARLAFADVNQAYIDWQAGKEDD